MARRSDVRRLDAERRRQCAPAGRERSKARLGPASLALFATLLAPVATAQIDVPENDGWVTDLAGFLTPEQERELERMMESYRTGTTHEIALLTVPDLGGQPIERLALEVGRAWGLGTEERNNGALLVVAREERKIRIEVGRGLEGTLTDAISSRIIRNVIAPRFKSGEFYEGIREGLAAMHAAIGGDYAQIPEERPPGGGAHFGGLLLLFGMFMVFMLIASRGRGGGGRGRRHRRSSLPWWLLAGMLASRGGGRHRSGGFGGGGFGGFGGGGGFSGGGATGGW